MLPFSAAFTVKILKIGTPKNDYRNCRKIGTVWFNNATMRLQDADGIGSSVDPDQTAPFRSSLIRVCIVCSNLLPKYLQFLRYANRQVWNFRSSLIRVCIVCSDLLLKYLQFLRYAKRQVWNLKIDNQNKHLTPSLVSLSKFNTLQKS